MLEIFEQFAFSSAVASIVGGAIGFLLKSYIDHSRNLQVEELRAELATLQHAQNTRFSRLHEEQAAAIKTIYSLIHDHRSSIADFLQSMHRGFDLKEQEAKLMKVFACSIALYEYHMKNRILFTHEVNALIDKVEKQQYDIPRPFFSHLNSKYVFNDVRSDSPVYSESLATLYKIAIEKLDKEFEKLCGELDEAFRRILGVGL